MITIRKSQDRGHLNFGWLDTYHSFSFGEYYDRKYMGFRSLRVINEDIVAPGGGFPEHPHDNMEIITYILSGALAHKDSLGSGETIRPGDVQHMTAGSGIRHSEFNPSKVEPVHLLQIWLKPGERDLKPAYDQVHFTEEARRDQLRLVASPDGADGSIRIFQDVRLYASLLSPEGVLTHAIRPERHAWVQVARGSVRVNGVALGPGDAAAVSDERELKVEATSNSEFLLFDLA